MPTKTRGPSRDGARRARRPAEAEGPDPLEAARAAAEAARVRRDGEWHHRVRANHRRAWILALPPLAVFVAGIVLIALHVLLALGAALAALALLEVALSGWRFSLRRALHRLGGHVPTDRDDARLLNLVDGLCVANGMAVPALLILEDAAPNAVSLGRPGRGDTIVVTTGLLDTLDRIELEGVLAHELAHLKAHDGAPAAAALCIAGTLLSAVPNGDRAVLRLVGPTREAGADEAGVAMTRYPPGLATALEKVCAAGDRRPRGLGNGVAKLSSPLWFAPFDGGASSAAEVEGALDPAERVALLHEL